MVAWIDAQTIKFKFENNDLSIPHVGWNNIMLINNHKYLENLSEKEFYFTHSYFVKCKNDENVIAKTNYGIEFDSIIQSNNVFGTQFHPEKSHRKGFELILNFAKS